MLNNQVVLWPKTQKIDNTIKNHLQLHYFFGFDLDLD